MLISAWPRLHYRLLTQCDESGCISAHGPRHAVGIMRYLRAYCDEILARLLLGHCSGSTNNDLVRRRDGEGRVGAAPHGNRLLHPARSQASEAPLSLSIKRRSLALALAHLTLQALPQQDRRLQPVCVCVCALICWRF